MSFVEFDHGEGVVYNYGKTDLQGFIAIIGLISFQTFQDVL